MNLIKSDDSVKGIKSIFVNTLMFFVVVSLGIMIFGSAFRVKRGYKQFSELTTEYNECTEAVNQIRTASDYLTDQARLFVINHDRIFLENYFYELTKKQSSNSSLDIIQKYHNDDAVLINCKLAIKGSALLQQREFYAMRLVCDALQIPLETLPKQLSNLSVSQLDNGLNVNEKLSLAQDMICNLDYLNAKQQIIEFSDKSFDALVTKNLILQSNIDEALHINMVRLVGFVVLLFVVIFVISLITYTLLYRPMCNYISCIEDGVKMQPRGTYEVRYIAYAYNKLMDKNNLTASILRHKAEHDPLTGLINREGFDKIKRSLTEHNQEMALLLIDIDYFKTINDQYGHVVGDEVLKKISRVLVDQFRVTDYVARIGGDEFSIIMTKFGEEPIKVIKQKIKTVNRILQNATDGLPPVSLSVGVSLSRVGYREELVEQADSALYEVKKRGRSDCSFYEQLITVAAATTGTV